MEQCKSIREAINPTKEQLEVLDTYKRKVKDIDQEQESVMELGLSDDEIEAHIRNFNEEFGRVSQEATEALIPLGFDEWYVDFALQFGLDDPLPFGKD